MSNAPFTAPLNPLFSIRGHMADDERTEIMERIERRLIELGMTWYDLPPELDIYAQKLNAWHSRGIPRKHYPTLATALGWSVDQLLGREEPHYAAGWPFQDIPAARYYRLSEGEQMAVRGAMLDKIREIEQQKTGKPGRQKRKRPARAA